MRCQRPILMRLRTCPPDRSRGTDRGALSEIFQSVMMEAALWTLKIPVPPSQSIGSKMEYIENHVSIFTSEETSHLKSISQVIFSPKVMGHLDEKGDGEENCLD